MLHVLHPRGGGTEKHVREIVASTRDRFRHHLLRSLPDRYRLVDLLGEVPERYDHRWHLADGGAAPCYDFPRDRDEGWLRAAGAWLGIDVIHVHSLVGAGEDLARELACAGVPYAYTAHDMYLPCPTIHLIDARGAYCNATTDVAACTRCLGELGYVEVDVARWRAAHGEFLGHAAEVHAPSRWAAETLATYFPKVQVLVVPPPPPRPAANAPERSPPWTLPIDDRIHVALLGAIGPEKGARILDALVERIRARQLPVRLVVIGYTDRETRAQSDDLVLTVHGPYGVADVGALLDRYRIDLALFPNVWPETFSYTLGEAWSAGRPALVPPVGAPKERVEATGAGWILEGWPDPDRILDQVVRIAADREALAAARANALAATPPAGDDAIVARYRAMIAASPRSEVAVSRRLVADAAARALAEAHPVASPARRGFLRFFGRGLR